MSKNLYFDPLTKDIVLQNFNLRLTTDTENVAQGIECRLKFFRGEWFLNQEIGIPYYKTILKKNPQLSVVNSIFRDAILSAPGVNEITTYNTEYKKDTRTYAISVTVNGNIAVNLEI